MSSRLAAARTLTFTPVTTYESPSAYGPEIAYTTMSDVVVQRPNELRVLTPGDGPAQQFFYDGKTVTAYAPAEDLIATATAVGTIDEVLRQAYHANGVFYRVVPAP